MTDIDSPLVRLTALMAEKMDVAVLLTSADLTAPGPHILYVNRAFEHLTGYTFDEVRGKSPRVLQGEKTSLATRKRLLMALRQGERHQATIINYRKSGEPYHCAIDIAPVKTETGQVVAALAFSWEVQRRAGRRSKDLTKPL